MEIEYKYIVDKYNKFQNNENVIETFTLIIAGERTPYCIRKIAVKEWDWGRPVLEDWEEQDFEGYYSDQMAYDSLLEAQKYVRLQKRAGGY